MEERRGRTRTASPRSSADSYPAIGFSGRRCYCQRYVQTSTRFEISFCRLRHIQGGLLDAPQLGNAFRGKEKAVRGSSPMICCFV